MIITIDTTQPVSDIDRAILAALLGTGPVSVPTPHAKPAAPVSTFQKRLAAAQSAKPRGAMEEARLPVTEQAGVRSTPSVEHSDPYDDAQDRHAGTRHTARRLTDPTPEPDDDAPAGS